MFKDSSKGTVPTLFGGLAQQFTGAKLKAFENPLAWHNIFRDQVTGRINETIFSVLFVGDNGRPNASVRVMVAMMILKEGHGWSDEELYEQCGFNAMVMNALGLNNIDDAAPVCSTYYAFRKRIYEYAQKEGIDLLGLCFRDLTRQQCKFFDVKGDKLRMDSKLIGSNIAKCSRLQLVIRCLQEFHKHMDSVARARLAAEDAEFFGKLGKKSAGQVVYPLASEEKGAMLAYCGELIMRLLQQFSESDSPMYAILARVFEDQFSVEADVAVVREPKTIASDSLQSPYDQDAEYRGKGNQKVQGYSLNNAETCSGKKDALELVTVVQVEGATFADPDFLEDAVEESQEVAGEVEAAWVDGAYHSQANDLYADLNEKELHYTGFQGVAGRFSFDWRGVELFITDTRTGEETKAEEYKEGKYRITTIEDGIKTHHRFDQQTVDNYFKRKKVEEMPAEIRNKRANVEATIFQMSFLTRNNKTRYRGKFKTQMWATSRAAWINLRRIVIYLGKLCTDEPESTAKAAHWLMLAIILGFAAPLRTTFARIRLMTAHFLGHCGAPTLNYACK
jgi:hypothetical protein